MISIGPRIWITRLMSFDPTLRALIEAHVARYAGARDRVAIAHLAGALALWAGGLALVAWSGHVATIVLGALLLLGAFLKLFMVHHDMMHGCFLRERRLHYPLALLVGSLCHVAPSVWRREHDRHHRTSNNLDEPQDGQTAPWTLRDYAAKPFWVRAAYRSVNHPAVLFTLGPIVYFFGFMRVRARLIENVAQVSLWYALYRADLLLIHLAVFVPAGVLGFVVFHAQHTFDGAYRRRASAWDPFENAMLGSSLLELPRWPVVGRFLSYCAHGVEYHHAHHLHPGIPGYRLARCHEDALALFDQVPRVSLARAFSTLHYALYDEASGRFIFPGRKS